MVPVVPFVCAFIHKSKHDVSGSNEKITEKHYKQQEPKEQPKPEEQ